MPPRDDRRRRGEEEKPVKPVGRPVWIYYLGGAALFIVLLLVTAFVGAWQGALSVPPPHPFEEEEAELRRLEEAQEEHFRVARGLDLARERPLARTGEQGRPIPGAPRLLLPGRATDAAVRETVPPEVKGELARPLHLRRLSAAVMERDLREVTAPLDDAGNLGRSEPIRTPPLAPRDATAAETGVPELETPEMRAAEARPLDAITGSTVVVPPGYTIGQDMVRPPPLPAR